MRSALAITGIALIASYGTVHAGSPRACVQVGTLVDGAIRPLLANPAETTHLDVTQLRGQLRTCLSSHNICTVLYDAQYQKEELIAGDVTTDLPAHYFSVKDKSLPVFLVRSIPRVRNDANQYCLFSAKHRGATSGEQWDVYGWVIAPKASDPLPLKRQLLDSKDLSDPRSLRALAAALWFFAERMSGQARPQ